MKNSTYLYSFLVLILLNSCFSSTEFYRDLPRFINHDFLELDQVHYSVNLKSKYSKIEMNDSLLNTSLSESLKDMSRSRINRFLKIEDPSLANDIQLEMLKLESEFINGYGFPKLEIPKSLKYYMDSIESDYLVLGWHYSCKKDIDAQIQDAGMSILTSLFSFGTAMEINQTRWTRLSLYLFDRRKNQVCYYNHGDYSETLKITDEKLKKDIIKLIKELYFVAK